MATNTHELEPSPADISFDEDHKYATDCETPTTWHSPNFEQVDLTDDESDLHRCRSSVNEYQSTTASIPTMYTLGCFSHSTSNIAKRRGFDFNLASFKALGVALPDEDCTFYSSGTSLDSRDFTTIPLTGLQVVDSEQPLHITRSRSLDPPTPPEDSDPASWLEKNISHTGHTSSTNTEVTESHLTVSGVPERNTDNNISRPSISMPQQEVRRESDRNLASPSWLMKALEVASSSFDKNASYCSKEIISQVLPAHATDQRSTKTYERVCDYLDGVLPNPEFTVTHVLAVEKTGGLKDFPKSPPSTPSFSNRESYFEDESEPRMEHQNMFTNIARVPLYHGSVGERASGITKTQRNVMAAKADLIVLERYIPPISATALKDFFDAESGRSYLADRLHELSLGGSMLLIYPLKDGGRTFQRNYIGPIIDPIVLEMTITRGLTAAAAETIATMSAVDYMLSLEEMEACINNLGAMVAARSGPRLPANKFSIAHSEKAEVLLDQESWKNWYLDQEQSRIKDDIIQYHKEGGRLPDALGRNEEITASIIAREVRDGLQNSRKETGNLPIEVGVFVIRRTPK